MLQAVERRRATINEFAGELRGKEVPHRASRSQRSWPHARGCAAVRVGWEVTIGVTVHEKMSNLRQRRPGGMQLRHEVKTRFGTICRQSSINVPNMGGTVEFEFKKAYESQMAIQEQPLAF